MEYGFFNLKIKDNFLIVQVSGIQSLFITYFHFIPWLFEKT